jgi:GntR family transcriptional regulator, vanillate catabolism transcriptional regulator
LLQALPHGGFAVRTFSEREVAEAIELRGMVEGLSARLAAERGAAPMVLSDARGVLLQIDALLQSAALTEEDFSAYVHLNQRFHNLLGELAGSELLAREMERAASMPFASPSAFVVLQATSPKARDMLIVAQDQHWQVLQAIEQREGSRAESVMREHSRLAQRNLRDAVRSSASSMPGVQLIRKRNAA